MSRKSSKRRVSQARAHQAQQRNRKEEAVREVMEKAKRQKKGPKFIAQEMERRGYLPDGRGGWRRMTTWAENL